MGWRTGVREIGRDRFESILERATISGWDDKSSRPSIHITNLPDIEQVTPVFEARWSDLCLDRPIPSGGARGGVGTSGGNRSKHAKFIGDRAEEVVFEYLSSNLPVKSRGTLKWDAKEGNRPGWDLHYVGDSGGTIGVEVKGTTAKCFTSFELTEHERSVASAMGERYHLFLVTECLSPRPRISEIPDPIAEFENGKITITPVLWRVSFETETP